MIAKDITWDVDFEVTPEIDVVDPQISIVSTITEPKTAEPSNPVVNPFFKSNNPYYYRWAQILTNNIK